MDASSDNNRKTSSLSYFQKTVCLHEWWLTKAEKEIEGKRLAVAGFTSREQQAVRVFSSAPILKRYDVFTLETTDGICVIIKGFINKARTEENGFPSEVFNHFVFGFPPHWEECAEKFLEGGFATKDVSKVDASIRGSSQVTPENYEKRITEVSRVDNEKMNMGVEDCGNMVLEDRQHSHAYTESSVELPKELGDDNVAGAFNVDLGSVETFLLTSQTRDHSCLVADPVNNDVNNIETAALKKSSFLINSAVDATNSLNITMLLEHSSHRMRRSRKRMDSEKNERISNRTQGHPESNESKNSKCFDSVAKIDDVIMESCLPKSSDLDNFKPLDVNKAVFTETSCINTRYLKRSDVSNRNEKNIMVSPGSGSPKCSVVSSFQNSETVVSCNDENHFGADNTRLSSVILGETEKVVATSVLLGETEKVVATSVLLGETEKVVARPSTPELPANCLVNTLRQPKGLSELEGIVVAPSIIDMDGNVIKSTDKVKRNCKSKKLRGKQKETAASDCNVKYKSSESHSALEGHDKNPGKEKLNTKSSLLPVGFGEKKDISKEIARHSEGRMSRCWLRCSKGRQKYGQTTVNLLENERSKFNSASVGGSGQAKKAAHVVSESRPRNISNKLDTGPQEHMDEITVRNSDTGCVEDGPKLDQNRGDNKIQAGSKKSSNKAVRCVTRLGGADNKDRKKIAAAEKESTSKEASTAGKKTKRKLTYESPVTPRGKEISSVVSPECLSCKRSRSGRLLLPALEYWRNQTAIYDVDRRITGIKEGLYMPSTGSKSEPQRKRKKRI